MVKQPTEEIYLKNYTTPDYLIEKTHLKFDLFEGKAIVVSSISIKRNGTHSRPLVLAGQELTLLEVKVDECTLGSDRYSCDTENLTIPDLPECFHLSVTVEIQPQDNTSLEGLYKSRTMFCTQCEAEGFRKITYYLDRPDVLSIFTTTVVADAERYPVLLSNGNLVESKTLEDGRHSATWLDPFPKPCYLFALVAGSLACVEDTFQTASGKMVDIELYVEEKDLNKCAHAVTSLKNAMTWDEKVYGREYDLDVYMIVAVDDFNMGAMENKGLNIFNTSCVLANPDTTTDVGFQRVEAVVAHEYFHNWSGNRVTCRDWFQLSLKEGFTVYRDAEFSADMGSRTVKRVQDVLFLRTHQFAEDGGPMAHPVQPASFMEISNFYTLTIYEKGAEVVRMIHTLLGDSMFRRATDLYFDRHDGQAVTIDDFVSAMSDVSGRDFSLFMNWYHQAGTPVLTISDHYEPDLQKYTMTIRQSCPTTPEADEKDKKPYHIPLAMGLLGEAGGLRIKLEGETVDTEVSDNTHRVIELKQAEETLVFLDVPERPIPSLLRGFSAPVKLEYDYSAKDLMRLMSSDDDGYCRWNAGQQLGLLALDSLQNQDDDSETEACGLLVEGCRLLLNNKTLDPAMVALMLELPSESYMGERQAIVLVDSNHRCRNSLKAKIAQQLKADLLQAYQWCAEQLQGMSQKVDSRAIALRSLLNVALGYLMSLDDKDVHAICVAQIERASNMTEVQSALTSLLHSPHKCLSDQKQNLLNAFYQRWKEEPLVVNQWLTVQASNPAPSVLARIEELMAGAIFDIKNPNKVRSLVGVFSGQNLVNFHRETGAGYSFLADQVIKLNQQNPQLAARCLTPLTKWRRHNSVRQGLMKKQLQRILDEPSLSKDVYEVACKSI